MCGNSQSEFQSRLSGFSREPGLLSPRRRSAGGMRGPALLANACFLLILLAGCTRAQIPVLLNVILPGNPQTYLNPGVSGAYAVLPNPVIVEVLVPYSSQINVAIDGTVLEQAQSPALQDSLQQQNLGFYSVLSSSLNSSNTIADDLLFVAPPPTKLQGPSVVLEIENESYDLTNVGADLVSPPIKIALVSISPATPLTPQSGAAAATACNFWPGPGTGGPALGPTGYGNTAKDASAYYSAVDPNNSKASLTAWKSANGFSPTDNSLDTANAIYFNAADLAFGRSMHMRVQGGNVAYYVSNYQTVDDARLNTNLIATVAMDYSPVPGINQGAPFIKFFVYSANGERVLSANLDGCGQKYVPGLCQICHNGGGSVFTASGVVGPHNANVEARFLPFDLDNFGYSAAPGYSRAEQETQFLLMNQQILSAYPSAAETELINGWYPCLGSAGCTQNSSFVPSGWAGSPSSSYYLNGIKLSCRTCHVSQDSPYDWATASGFSAQPFGAQVIQHVCQSPPTAATNQPMPDSKVTWLNFWLSTTLPGSPGAVTANILAAANQPGVGNCPNY